MHSFIRRANHKTKVEIRLYLYDMGKKFSKLVKTPLNVDFLSTDV